MNSFRKRNLVITPRGPPSAQPPSPLSSSASSSQPNVNSPTQQKQPQGPPPGVRPSPVNGQYTTSTGTPSLDSLLAGHAGLPLGCSLLIEEPGTTEYGGALLRYYAAEGIAQGHAVTVIGFGEAWARGLPGITGDAENTTKEQAKGGKNKENERMKIAWRYERLGEFGSGIGGSRAQAITPKRAPPSAGTESAAETPRTFCHTFDLTKRLSIPSTANLHFIPPPSPSSNPKIIPFTPILQKLTARITSLPSGTPHRLVIPGLLNPGLYPPSASLPSHLLQFLHSLRSLLRQHPYLTLLYSLPTELYPRTTGLVRWLEILSDGVIELLPLPRKTASAARIGEEEPQGLVKLWKLPVLGEKGGGVGATVGAGEDLAFLVTRRRFEITAYSLPPADDEEEDGGGGGGSVSTKEGRKATKVDLEF